MQLYLILVIIAVLIISLNYCNKYEESFYDWQTLGVDSRVHEYSGPLNVNKDTSGKDCRTPHYRHIHPMFINTDCVGCGSCIYNKLDPNFDGVLPDWQWTLQNFGNTLFKSPPLDSEIYTVPEGCDKCKTC